MGGTTFLTESNLPPHKHSFSATTSSDGLHTHNFTGYTMRGSINHLVRYDAGDAGTYSANGVFSNTETSGTRSWQGVNGSGARVRVQFNGIPSGTNSNSGTHSHTISGTTYNTGSKAEYWQPYITCYCWYRTA